MKKLIQTLGLATLFSLSSGCKEDKVVHERTFSGDSFGDAIGDLGYYSNKPKFNVYVVSTWRNYPCAGPQKTLPRAELKTYDSGRKVVDLYFAKK